MVTRDDVFDKRDIEKKKDYISDYTYTIGELTTQIALIKDVITDPGMCDTLDWLLECFENEEGTKYEDYQEDVNEYDNFNPLDYNDNDGLGSEYERSKL